jgi:hypothetical protein
MAARSNVFPRKFTGDLIGEGEDKFQLLFVKRASVLSMVPTIYVGQSKIYVSS